MEIHCDKLLLYYTSHDNINFIRLLRAGTYKMRMCDQYEAPKGFVRAYLFPLFSFYYYSNTHYYCTYGALPPKQVYHDMRPA